MKSKKLMKEATIKKSSPGRLKLLKRYRAKIADAKKIKKAFGRFKELNIDGLKLRETA